jgi:hypothetical protein
MSKRSLKGKQRPALSTVPDEVAQWCESAVALLQPKRLFRLTSFAAFEICRLRSILNGRENMGLGNALPPSERALLGRRVAPRMEGRAMEIALYIALGSSAAVALFMVAVVTYMDLMSSLDSEV